MSGNTEQGCGLCGTAGPTEALVRELVSNDGFQSAVMTLVTHCGEIVVKPGRVVVLAPRGGAGAAWWCWRRVVVLAPLTDLDLRSEVPLAVGAMLRHLASRA